MAIFEVFAREQRELSNSELARFIGIADSSCADLLHTLYQAGYVTRTARTKRFYPTSRLFSAAQSIAENDPTLQISREAIELLASKTGETALCGRLESGFVRVIGFQEGKYQLRYVMKVGEKMALHGSALGKALLAQTSPEEAARHLRVKPLRKLTPHSMTDPAQVEAAVDQVRAQGWAEARSEGVLGVGALAVGGLVGGEPLAISLTGPQDRIDEHRDLYLQVLLEVRAAAFSQPDSPVRATARKSPRSAPGP